MFSPLITQPYDVDDFSGGITDNYLDCRKNQYQGADNLLITDNKKLMTRGGSEIVDETNYLPGYLISNNRTSLLFAFEDQIFEVQGRNLYYNSSGYATMTGPTGNVAFPAGSLTSKPSWAYWNHHVILTNDAFGSPQKLYKDSGGVFRIRTAGLPALATSPAIAGSNALVFAFANDLKAKYNAHCADAAQHTTAPDATNTISSANASNLATLITLVTEMLSDFTAHEADSQLNSGWAFHKAKATASRAVASAVPPTTLAECITRLSDIKSKFNSHDNDATAHGVGGSHQVILADPVSRTYIYAFVYSYTYTVGTVIFKDFGATTIVEVSGVDMPSVTNAAVTAIPVLANGATENYDTTVIKCEIYRTLDAGQVLYKLGEVTNGTTVYTDSTSDTTLEDSTVIYTDGDVLDFDTPPLCKYVIVANDICWYLHVKEGTEVHTNRFRQSVKFDIDACPGQFYKDLEDEITGGANVGIYPVIFCKERVYRIEGFYDLLGQGFIEAREISRNAGCVSHLGIVVTLEGVFFPGNDGFYWTDAYQVVKISQEINSTYSELVASANQKAAIYGCYDAINKRVYWGCWQDLSSGDSDCMFIADLKFRNDRDIPFTTASGGTSMAPTALLFFNRFLYRADKRGYLFKHDEDLRTDPKVSTLAVPADWQESAIIYDFRSHGTHFGSVNVRKWVPSMVIHCKNTSNTSLGINSLNDDSTVPNALKEIRVLSNLTWGDSAIEWGDADIIWNYVTMIKALRRFPARTLRCAYKQIQLTNSFTIVDNSDSLGVANVDAVAKTATLVTAPTNVWLENAVDYYLTFSTDSYVKEYQVTARTDSVLSYSDALNTSTTGSNVKWLLKGYRKSDIIHLLNYSINFALLSSTHDPYRVANSGVNA